MEPAAWFATAATLVCGVPPLAAAVREMEWRLPSRWAGGLVVAASLSRTVPVMAQLPPPPIRWEEPSQPAEEPEPETLTISVEADPRPGASYRVRTGDSLWAIACRALGGPPDAEVDRYWRAIYRANREVVGNDPDLIFPGQTLVLPKEW